MNSGSDKSTSSNEEGMQLSMLSRKRLVRLVTESQQNHQQQLLNHRLTTAQKKNNPNTKRSKVSERPKVVEKNPRSDSLQHMFLQHASAAAPPTTTPSTNNGSHLATDPLLDTRPMETDDKFHHHTTILPPSLRVDTGADEQLSSKSGGTGVTPPPPPPAPAVSCPPPVVYYRRATTAGGGTTHMRTSYRSLTSNASSTAAELDCLLSVSTPPGFLRNTTSSSVRWTGERTGAPRPANPVPMQVEGTSNNAPLWTTPVESAPMTDVTPGSGAPSWTPQSDFAPYQYQQYPGQYHC